MPNYTVKVQRTEVAVVNIPVFADTEAEAKTVALDRAGDINFFNDEGVKYEAEYVRDFVVVGFRTVESVTAKDPCHQKTS